MPPVPVPVAPSLISSSWNPRIICYMQTYHKGGSEYVSLLPLITNPSGITHLILAALHVNPDPTNFTLNDDPPSHLKYTQLWDEVVVLQDSGIKVLAMLGGAAKGSFARLDHHPPQQQQIADPLTPTIPTVTAAQFETYYSPLRDFIRLHNLDGLDLDVEEDMTLPGVIHLIDRLKADFGPSFIITLAPVATALMEDRPHLSGFDYKLLEAARGSSIAWYNTQFYCGWGGIHNTDAYDEIVRNGWRPDKVVAGMLTNPKHATSGYVPLDWTAAVLSLLVEKYPTFGGVMGWELTDSLPQEEHPWLWSCCMALCMGMKKVRDAAVIVSVGRTLAGINMQGGLSRTRNERN